MDRETGLADLEQARGEFDVAMAGVPDAALGHLKAGDDYSLSGLVPHCEYVFRHYSAVLDGMAASVQFRAVDPADLEAWHKRSSREGFTAGDRSRAMAALREWHLATVERLRKVADWEAKVPVLYGAGAAEPYPTSAADINGWLTDHYREHVPHVAELLAGWQAAQAPKPA
jgi:hypothetical protein